eukprot:1192367-Amphidinium_carterae.1
MPKPDSTTGESYYYSSSEEAAPAQAKPKTQRMSSRKDRIKPQPQAKQIPMKVNKRKRGRKTRKARQAVA